MSTLSASSRPGNSAVVTLPSPDARIRLESQGWAGYVGEHAEFGNHTVAWTGQGFVNSRYFTERVSSDEAEQFATSLIMACNIAGIPDQDAQTSAAIVTVPLPAPDAADPDHEPGYLYFGDIGAKPGQPVLLVYGEFMPVSEAWTDALHLLAASRLARTGVAA